MKKLFTAACAALLSVALVGCAEDEAGVEGNGPEGNGVEANGVEPFEEGAAAAGEGAEAVGHGIEEGVDRIGEGAESTGEAVTRPFEDDPDAGAGAAGTTPNGDLPQPVEEEPATSLPQNP